MQEQEVMDPLQLRRLKEAVRYVSRTWLPVNVKNLQLVQSKVEQGHYANQRNEFINDLKADFSLLAFCLRKLETVITPEQVQQNPIDTLRNLEIEQLKSLLSSPDGEISIHRLEDMKEIQAHRIKHSLISCGAAEVLARKTSIDPDFAYTCAMMRQLGFLLVAWNYPTSFQKAVAAVTASGNDIETELAKIVGFNTAHLGFEVTLNWNKSADFKRALGWKVSEAAQQQVPNVATAIEAASKRHEAQTIGRYCELGEKLAKVSNKEHYPNAVTEWKEAEKELNGLIGASGIKIIAENVSGLCRNYSSFAVEIFSKEIAPDITVKKANTEFITKLIESNVFLPRCPEALQKEFKEVYNKIVPGEVSSQAVSQLVTYLIPAAGFVRGCIFLMDPATAQLVPRVRIGDSASRAYKPVSCSASGEKSNPISEAFHCSAPLKQEKAFLLSDVVSHVSGKFGNNSKSGVLFLEISDELLGQENHVPVVYFKAIRRCLDDCLNLSTSN